jgi:hypothetical protein
MHIPVTIQVSSRQGGAGVRSASSPWRREINSDALFPGGSSEISKETPRSPLGHVVLRRPWLIGVGRNAAFDD